MSEKLWNKNFFLLWQGQLISLLGDAIYIVALNFYILDLTGSTALMGLLTATSMIPRVIISPIAGVFVDRLNLRNILIVTDFIRGIFVLFVGIITLMGHIDVWMIFAVAIINSICSSFFNPAAQTLRPELVAPSLLTRATSLMQLADSSSNVIGSAIAGVLYVVIGPAWMFIFNGVSYLYAAFSELFITYNFNKKISKSTFIEDFKAGLKYLLDKKNLRNFILLVSFGNFFFYIGFILLVPFFKEQSYLGVEKYGFFLTAMGLGSITSSFLLSTFKIKREKHFYYALCGVVLTIIPFVSIPLVQNYYLILIAGYLAMLGNTTFGSLYIVSLIESVEKSFQGKVFSLVNTIVWILTPLAILIGGSLGEFLNLQLIMISAFGLSGLSIFFMIILPNSKSFFNGN